MSQVYATEPSTAGKVLFETTHGPIEIHLWCRECPATVRFFLQLVLDGYYDGLIFHRILSNFLVQTGLRPAEEWKEWKQHNREAYQNYMERRKLETHSRIKFNHRGQVAMALQLDNDDEQGDAALLEPQFFVTLDEAPYLNDKHVVFGTVAMGPTVFNALRIGNVTNVNDQGEPLDWDDAPRVKSTKIQSYQLDQHQLQASTIIPWNKKDETTPRKKKKKRKGKRDTNVLSFGNEEEELQEGGGMQSSHDFVPNEKAKPKELTPSPRENMKDTEYTNQTEMKRPKLKEEESSSRGPTLSSVVVDKGLAQEELKTINGKDSTKREVSQRKDDSEKDKNNKSKSSYGSMVEAKRLKYRKASSKSKKQREEDTMTKLTAFQNKVRVQQSKKATSPKLSSVDNSLASRMANRALQDEEKRTAGGEKHSDEQHYHGHDDGDRDNGEKETSSWLATRFHCRQHMDQRGAGDGRDMNDYLVVDNKKKDRRDGRKKKKQT